jgi:hypothetical protein
MRRLRLSGIAGALSYCLMLSASAQDAPNSKDYAAGMRMDLPDSSRPVPDVPEFEQTYDKFRDATTTELKLGRVINGRHHTARIDVCRFYKGEGRNKDRGAPRLYFVSRSSESWVYLKYRPLILLVDSNRMELSIDHDGTVGKGYVLEHMWADLSDIQLAKISAAKTVEGRLGSDEFVLQPNQIAAIKEFAALISNPERPLPEKPKVRLTVDGGKIELKPSVDPKPIPRGEGVLSDEIPYMDVVTSEKALDEWDRFVDASGLRLTFIQRKTASKEYFAVKAGTRVSILERLARPKSKLFSHVTKIEVLDGANKGLIGWVDDMSLVFGPPDPEKLKQQEEVRNKAESKRLESERQSQIEQKFNLGQALEKTNQKGALKYYEEVVKLNPESPLAKKAKARIKALSK